MKKFDGTIWIGVIVGLAAIFFGAWIEGLDLSFLFHTTAALIVFGGTIGAVIVRRGIHGILSVIKTVWNLQIKDNEEDSHTIDLAKLAWLSRSANKHGIQIYETHADNTEDALIAQGLTLLAEDSEQEKMTEVLSRQLNRENEKGSQDISTLDAAGGFAPTFGILAAVIGLISALKVVDNADALGAEIATAFIATIYGIGSANLIFFPLASRLRSKHQQKMNRREEIASVLISLSEKQNPRAIINQFNLRK